MKDIPENWSRTRLADISEIIRGVTYKKAQASESSLEGHLPILRATNIQENHLVLDQDLIFVPQDLVSEKQQLREGDIVVATSSGSKHLVGKTAQVKKSWAGSFGAFCAAIRPSAGIDHHYLGYFFESREYKDFIAKQALGVNINNLRRGDLEKISVPIAPLEQQKRIVAEIEKQFSRLDEAVANLKRVKANLKHYKAAVLKAAVEGKLTEEWRKQHPNVEPASKLLERILTERRQKWEEAELAKMKAKGKVPKDDKWKKKYKEPAGPDESDMPELPDAWTWATLEQIADVQLGKMLDRQKHRTGQELPYLRNVNVRWDSVDTSDLLTMFFKDAEIERYALQAGDVLVCEGGEPGRAAVWSGQTQGLMYQKALHRVRFHTGYEQKLLVFVLEYLAKSGRLERWFTGVTIKHFTRESFAKFPNPLAPYEEQSQIVAKVEKSLSLVSGAENQVEANLIRAERLRQSILTKAFSGQLNTNIIESKSNPIKPVSVATKSTG